MHPRITRLYVNNYRSFVNFELRPGRRSLLLGYNGTGKSSVFDVLHGIRALVIGNNDIKHVFPTDTVTKFGGSPEQRFEIDIDTERGVLRYALRVSHQLDEKTVTIASEELTLEGKPFYSFTDGEVQLHSEGETSAKSPFQFLPQRSYLASFDPRAPLSPIASFKSFLEACLACFNASAWRSARWRERNFQKNVGLVVTIDADNKGLQGRVSELLNRIATDASDGARRDGERIALVVPAWEIESWYVHLCVPAARPIDEAKDYKPTREWRELEKDLGAAAKRAVDAWAVEAGRVDPPSLIAARAELDRVQ